MKIILFRDAEGVTRTATAAVDLDAPGVDVAGIVAAMLLADVPWRVVDAGALPQGIPPEQLAVDWDGDGAIVVSAPDQLAAAQAERIADVRVAAAARMAAGMAWQGKVLQIDAESLGLLTGADAMAAAGGLPPGFAWRMADNSFLPLDAEGLRAMALAAGALVYAIRAVGWAKVDAIRAAADPAAVAAIDPATGWPE